MPFFMQTNRVKILSSFGHIFLPELREVDKGNGVIETIIEQVDQSKELPPFELFDLKNQLSAGVDLKKVNGKILAADTYPIDGIMSEQDSNNKQEQTNEQEQTNKQEQTNQGE